MKTRSYLLIASFLVLVFSLNSYNSFAQKKQKGNPKETSVQQWLDAKKFVFVAQAINPSHPAIRQLALGYNLHINNDSLVAELPFFGRAYSAPINPQDNGIRFTSTSYTYDIKQRKKKWEITLRPQDVSNVQNLFLTVFQNGSASLQVVSRDRETMSFSGYVQKL